MQTCANCGTSGGMAAVGTCTRCKQSICAQHLVAKAWLEHQYIWSLRAVYGGSPQPIRVDFREFPELPPRGGHRLSHSQVNAAVARETRITESVYRAWADGTAVCESCRWTAARTANDTALAGYREQHARVEQAQQTVVHSTDMAEVARALADHGAQLSSEDAQAGWKRLTASGSARSSHDLVSYRMGRGMVRRRAVEVQRQPGWYSPTVEYTVDDGDSGTRHTSGPGYLDADGRVYLSSHSSHFAASEGVLAVRPGAALELTVDGYHFKSSAGQYVNQGYTVTPATVAAACQAMLEIADIR